MNAFVITHTRRGLLSGGAGWVVWRVYPNGTREWISESKRRGFAVTDAARLNALVFGL